MSVIVTVPIPDDLVARLEQKARTAGMERDQYVRDIVSRDLAGPRPLDEILQSVRDEAAVSEMADSDLLEIFEDARVDARVSETGVR